MAIYHLSAKPIQRSKGRSAVASAAYRSAKRIEDERTGVIHDYTNKSGVVYTEIITPSGEEISRAILWNLAEKTEKRKDGTPAREYEIALPRELTSVQRLELTREFANYLIKKQGCAVDIAIHAPGKDGDIRNHHAHILCTTRRYEAGQTMGAKCDIELSDRDRYKKGLTGRKVELENVREKWAELLNNALEQVNELERVSHKSFLAQGIEQMPTIHIGVAASSMERRGIQTERGDKYRDCIKYNTNLEVLILQSQPKNAFERRNSPKEAFKPDTRTFEEKEQAAIKAYKAWVQEFDKQAATPPPEPKPKTLEEQISDYLNILDQQIEQKQYFTLEAYENNEKSIKEAAKSETDFYRDTRHEAAVLILDKRFTAYMGKVRIEADKEINSYKKKLENLAENKPKSLFKSSKYKTELYRWEGNCKKIREAIEWQEKKKNPDFYQHQHEKNYRASDEEIEQRLNKTLSPESRQRIEKAKIINNLVEQMEKKSSTLRVRVMVLERKAQELGQSRSRGR